MNSTLRFLLAAVVLLAFGSLLLLMDRGSRRESGAPPATATGRGAVPIDASTCRACHPRIYAQWWGSQHRLAYLNPDVIELSNKHENKNCIPCHAPRPVFELGISAMSRSRMLHREQGVSCLTCHLIPASASADRTARLAGLRDIPAGTCALEVSHRPELQSADFCAGCHNQHETTDQWRATIYARPGPQARTCQDCHLPRALFPPAAGIEARPSIDHTCPGSHDRDTIRSALEFSAKVVGEAIEIRVKNAAAGHHFPTEERSRAADIWLEFHGAGGESLAPKRKLYRFRDPYRGERGIEPTLLPHGKTLSLSVPRAEWPAGARLAVVWMEYLRRPYEPVPPSHRYELFREEIKLP